jgi:hypothetical protein
MALFGFRENRGGMNLEHAAVDFLGISFQIDYLGSVNPAQPLDRWKLSKQNCA